MNPNLGFSGHKLKEGKLNMRFDWKEAIRRLYDIIFPHTSDLTCHTTLVFFSTYMLNHRIGKNNIETLIVKLRKIARIADEAPNIWTRVISKYVKDCQRHIFALNHVHRLLKIDCSPHIQNFDWLG